MMACTMAAAGRGMSVPSKYWMVFQIPVAVPRMPMRARSAAPCMACIRSFSLRARRPRRSRTMPKAAGMSAVMLAMPLMM